MFDTLIVRSFMTPSIAALLGRWFWWPQVVRPRPASRLLESRGSRSMVRSLLLPKGPRDGGFPVHDGDARPSLVDDDTDTKPLHLVENGHRRQVRVPDRFSNARPES